MPRRPRARLKTRRPPPQPCANCQPGDARQMIGSEGPFCDRCAVALICAAHRDGWIMRAREVEARLVWRDDRPGYDVVVDGRRLSWEEFGAVLEPFEGWTFHLEMRDIDIAQ